MRRPFGEQLLRPLSRDVAQLRSLHKGTDGEQSRPGSLTEERQRALKEETENG